MEVYTLMEKIRIKNIRSLKDTGIVPLAPVTLLVGENSSGKSTFLRTFPLLKQSISKKTDGPILWAGDVDDYVDFGSFKETITAGSNEKMEIEFHFRTHLRNERLQYLSSIESIDEAEESKVLFSITVEADGDKEYVSILNLIVDKTKFQVLFAKDKQTRVLIDGQEISSTGKDFSSIQNRDDDYFFWVLGRNSTFRSIFGYTLPNLSRIALSVVTPLIRGARRTESYSDMEALLVIGKALINGIDLFDFDKYSIKYGLLLESASATKKKITTLVTKIRTADKTDMEKYVVACKLFFFSYYYPQIEEYVEKYFRQVHYIAPLRATAERYYRLRNSAIDEIDYQGKNLAIFLNSLDHRRMISFQAWTQDNFGFKAVVQKNVGHLSVAISRDGFDGVTNLSDTGFGYSQILPIITQLWELSSRTHISRSQTNDVIPLVIAIEQPELHLHPAMQGRLAKAFIACIKLAKENGYQLQLLLETHSKTLVDYFGRAIARRVVKTSDIAVVLFERDATTGYTEVTKTSYDSTGALNKWPIGFFEPEE